MQDNTLPLLDEYLFLEFAHLHVGVTACNRKHIPDVGFEDDELTAEANIYSADPNLVDRVQNRGDDDWFCAVSRVRVQSIDEVNAG